MAKLAVFAVLFSAFIALASATTYTTVVTTTVDEEGNPQQSCQREMQQMGSMSGCMQYMRSQMGRGPYEASFLRSDVANPEYQEEGLQECCSELRRVSSPCRCEAMRHMMRQMQQHYGQEEQMQMMKERMQSLPQMCNMRSPTECRFPVVFV